MAPKAMKNRARGRSDGRFSVTCNVQRAACNVQRATCNVQHATSNVQHATCNVQRSPGASIRTRFRWWRAISRECRGTLGPNISAPGPQAPRACLHTFALLPILIALHLALYLYCTLPCTLPCTRPLPCTPPCTLLHSTLHLTYT